MYVGANPCNDSLGHFCVTSGVVSPQSRRKGIINDISLNDKCFPLTIGNDWLLIKEKEL